MRSMILYRRLSTALTVIVSIMAISCGKSINDAQEFTPNHAPVIEGNAEVTARDTLSADRTKITIGASYAISVRANDPDGGSVSYSFTSSYGSFSDQNVTAGGCSVNFLVKSVPAGEEVTVQLSVTDEKKASVNTSIDIGTGMMGAQIIINSIAQPYYDRINKAGHTVFTFSATGDGFYQVVEADSITDPASYRKPLTGYHAADGAVQVTVGGPDYSGAALSVSSGDGTKKIWIIFRDRNYHYVCGSLSITVENVKPSIVSVAPASGSENVPTSPVISLTFSEDVSPDSLTTALSVFGISGTSISFISYNQKTLTAVYNIAGLNKNTLYTAKVSNVTDVAGNIINTNPFTFTFKTTPTFAVVYNGNGISSGISSVSYEKNVIATVTSSVPSRPGYEFNGWNTSSTGDGTGYTAGNTFIMPANDVILYAQWTGKTYSIKFNDNSSGDGSLSGTMNDQSIVMGSGVNLNTNTYTRSNYYFIGWATTPSGSVEYTNNAGYFLSTAGNVTLYAVWAPYRSVTYVGNSNSSGTVPVDTTKYKTNDSATVSGNSGNLVGAIIRDGIKGRFTGWNTAADGSGTPYSAGSTLIMGSSNVTLYARYSGTVGGIGPGTGIVFYDKGASSGTPSWRYLELAPDFFTDTYYGGFNWSNIFSVAIGTTGTAIGTGTTNTTAIIAQSGHTSSAAKMCKDYRGGGLSDWFLPSKDELGQLLINRSLIDPCADIYWSSSEYDYQSAWELNLGHGALEYYDGNKSWCSSVRPVRRF